MKIERAIKELEITLGYRQSIGPTGELEALALGIEALKRIRHDREAMQAEHVLLLPGETEE